MPPRGALVPLLAAIALAAACAPACRCSSRPVPADLVQDFEDSGGIGRWPADGPGAVEISSDWKVDGEASLRVDPGLLGTTSRLRRSDLRGFDALRIHVHNTSRTLAVIGFELSDDHDSLHDRHKSAFGAPPGDTIIDVDLSGDLWRGEESRPYRGPTKTPIDLGRVSRIGFENHGDRPVYFDAITLVRDPLPAPKGALAFDFGKRGSRVMGKTQGVFEDSVYGPAAGFGFVSGRPSALRNTMTYPSPLLGDGLAWEDAVFQVDLTGGPYIGWVAFERGGFWEEEATGYSEASLFINGSVAVKDTFAPSGPHFLFEDVEVTRVEDAAAALVWPAHAVRRFSFDAKAGKNAFSLEVRDRTGPPLRVAGLFLAPDTAEGRAFIDAQEERQRRSLHAAFPPADRSRGPADAEMYGLPIVMEQRPVGEVAHPTDRPEAPFTKTPPVSAIGGRHTYVQLALYAPETIDVSISVTMPSGAAIPAPSVSYGVYGPKRPYEGGAAWIETQYFRPLSPGEEVRVGPGLSRSILLDFNVPSRALDATFSVRVSRGGEELAGLPLTLHVSRVELPPLPFPVGVFMSALPFGPELLGEERWWKWQEDLLAMQAEAGLNTPTGGAGLDFKMEEAKGGYTFSGERALRYLEIAKRYGVDRAVVCYTGFLPSIKRSRPDAARFMESWSAFEASHGLPPHYLYAYDEPSTPEELSEVAGYLSPFHEAGARTIGFLARAEGDGIDRVLDATFAPAVSAHTAAQLRTWAATGKRVFLYNQGAGRLSMGADLLGSIRSGAAGRLEWIGLYTQGFAFNDLDGREPSYGMFVVHDRLGVLPTPRWLALREGLIDARLRLALEKALPGPADPWPATSPADPSTWTDSELDKARAEALRRLEGSAAPP